MLAIRVVPCPWDGTDCRTRLPCRRVAMFCVEDKDSYTKGDEPEGARYPNEEDSQGFHVAYLLALVTGHG
jgi:hypothetical protein